MSPAASSLLAVALISTVSLVGLFSISAQYGLLKRAIPLLVSLAAGTLIGDVFFHIIPELYQETTEPMVFSLAIVLGIVAFFLMESVLHWHHHHSEVGEQEVHAVGINNLVADGLHNLVDGMIVAAGFLISPEIGVATAVAVLLHEIPQEIGDFGILVHAGFSRAQALFLNFLSALMAVLGAMIVIVVGESAVESVDLFLAFAAGGFLYIAIADLLPELKCQTNLRKAILQLLVFIVGLGVMYGLTTIE